MLDQRLRQVPSSLIIPYLFSSVLLHAYIFVPTWAVAEPYFEDGFIGLAQSELREKLGPPQAVRDRKAALRVFNYYSFNDWEAYYKKLVAPQNGEDVYKYKRDGIDIRYSFGYALDPNDSSESPTLHVKLVDIEFSPSVPLERIPALVPEFRPRRSRPPRRFGPIFGSLFLKGRHHPMRGKLYGSEAERIWTGRWRIKCFQCRGCLSF